MKDDREPEITRPVNRPHCRPKRTRRRPFLAVEFMERRIVCSGGALDTSFNGTGMQVIPFPDAAAGATGSSTASANAVAVESDGDSVMVGSAVVPIGNGSQSQQFAVVRLDSGGQLDATFGTGGQETIPVSSDGLPAEDNGNAVAIQPNGDIVIAGGAEESGPGGSLVQVFTVLRLMPDGSLDPSFGTGGVQTVAFPGSSSAIANAIAIQPNGDIVVAGETELFSLSGGGSAGIAFAVARLTPSGALDTTFGDGGGDFPIPPTPENSPQAAYAMALQSNGQILLAGSSNGAFAVVRLNSDGTPDAAFGDAGLETFRPRTVNLLAETARAIALEPDGQIVVAGQDNDGFIVARLDANGTLDSTFNGTGVLSIQSGDSEDGAKAEGAQAVVVEADGHIDVAGTLANPYVDFEIAGVNPDGTLDTAFGDAGIQSFEFSQDETPTIFNPLNVDVGDANALALTPDDKLVVAGSAGTPTAPNVGTEFAVARLLLASSPTPNPTPTPTPTPTPSPTPRPTPTPTPTPTPPPSPPPRSSHTPPRIARLRATAGRGGAHSIVLQLDQAIASRPAMPVSIFSLEALAADATFDQPVRIVKAAYNSRAHTITLALARRPAVHGTIQITVSAAGIVNRFGQELAGDGISGDDFVSLIYLR
jgi:uncharacterized delta-60 repeat protein